MGSPREGTVYMGGITQAYIEIKCLQEADNLLFMHKRHGIFFKNVQQNPGNYKQDSRSELSS